MPSKANSLPDATRLVARPAAVRFRCHSAGWRGLTRALRYSYLLVALTLAPCARSSAASPDTASPEALLSFYDYPGPPTNFSVRLVETRERYLIYHITWRSWVHTDYPVNNQAVAHYYQPRRSGKVPAVVVLHSYATRQARRERKLCGHLADRGIACLLPHLPYHYLRTPVDQISGRLMISGDVERTLEAVRQAVIDIRCGVDWLQQRPEVDPDRIGVVGLSLGGILTHLVMGVESRFSVGVTILGGGQVADVLWKSPILAHVRRQLAASGIGLDELRERLRPIEPLTFAQRNRPRQVLMINGRYDIIVPPHAARAVWRALGEPPIIWLHTGHYGPEFVASQVFEMVSAYLRNKFGERRGPLPDIHEYTVKVGVLMDERFGLSATVNLSLAYLGDYGSVDLALTTDGPLIGVSGMVRQGTELGLGMRLGKGRGRVRPYLAFVVVL